ncbi:MAG: tRNA glutamyl-Q(34) synthetase GluQRS [Chloroflexi bacterium]|nr:tRNA glutamyl-Q(34) synthetase GluQRS [Chloroflexota bacterium]
MPDAGGFGAALDRAIAGLPRGLRTRFAPAPTGYLHLGHAANALVVWRAARETGGSVVLRIEDHDRQRCRPAYESALVDDLTALGFRADEPTPAELRDGRPSAYRQSDNGPAYATAAAVLDGLGRVYACDCTRATFAEWAARRGRPWSGRGCPGGCAARDLERRAAGRTWRVDLGEGSESWTDLAAGPLGGEVAAHGDPPIRDRHGNWTYALCVVVDDLRHGIDLVIRGEDLLEATAPQVRLGRLLGRAVPPRFLHHPLVRRADGRKLSKADGDTAVRDLLATGLTAAALRGRAATAIGLEPDAP